MSAIRNITQVTLENLHELVPEYIHNNNIIIQNYEDMKEVYLGMIRDRYLFTFDRDILISCLTDLTYMYAPGDDLNKDAVVELLVLEGDEYDEEDNDEGDNDEGDNDEGDNDEEVNDDVNRSLDIPSLIQQTSVNSSSDIDDQCTSGM